MSAVAPDRPGRIRVMSPELADQIAAGEVVERPASVVKELVENALDAGAHRVEVEVAGAGLELIAVSDDGGGMSRDEAHLAVRRHATSKLAALDDLFTLASMGFRGEALPSIAAVSRLTLTTRDTLAAAEAGAYELEVRHGIVGGGRIVGGPVGTRIEVRDLFGNVPARRKFLKGEATESAHITETLLRLALAFPEVHFRLRSDGRVVHDLPPHGGLGERAQAALGRVRGADLHLAAGEEGGVRVEAYLGSPAKSTSGARLSYLFVNRRFVRDRSLLHAIALGYGETLERGRYPLVVVHLTLPGNEVDVNVHPQKLEVRFTDAAKVHAAVRHILGAAVKRAPWLAEPPGAAVARGAAFPEHRAPGGDRPTHYDELGGRPRLFARERGPGERSDWRAAPSHERLDEAMRPFLPAGVSLLPAAWLTPPASVVEEPAAAADVEPGAGSEVPGYFSSLVYLGQLHQSYLVCQAPGELVLIDQHAAHERVAFERLRAAYGRRALGTQRLLVPARVELEALLAAQVTEQAAMLGALGFELEPFGERTVLVRALPGPLAHLNPAGLLAEVLGDFAAHGASDRVQKSVDGVLATMACHSVVRAGDALTPVKVRALLESMDGVDHRVHCPHGRPVLLRLALAEIERRFGRLG